MAVFWLTAESERRRADEDIRGEPANRGVAGAEALASAHA